MDEDSNAKAVEDASKAIYEAFRGKGRWRVAGPADRSHARQALRLAEAALEKNGLTIGRTGAARPAARASAAAARRV